MKISKVILNIMSIVCFIYGALYTFSLVFIPVGVYCFIAGRRFSYKAENLYNSMTLSDKDFKSYVIFSCIACFPLGLLAIIPYMILTSNNVTVSDTNGLHLQKEENAESDNQNNKDVKVETVSETDLKTEKSEDSKTENAESKAVEAQKDNELSDVEKQEKYEKLKKFKEKGIITEEELNQAYEQLFGKKQ